MVIDEQNPTPRQFNLAGLKQIQYQEMRKAFLEMMPEKFELFQKDEKQKMFKKQNPSVDKEAAIPTLREYKEIKNQKDYADVCKSHKICAIGILPAITATSK